MALHCKIITMLRAMLLANVRTLSDKSPKRVSKLERPTKVLNASKNVLLTLHAKLTRLLSCRKCFKMAKAIILWNALISLQ